MDLINHYAEAVRFCLLIGDEKNEAFFRDLWNDEQHHGEELSIWLRDLSRLGPGSEARASF
jgi:bacterioferritin